MIALNHSVYDIELLRQSNRWASMLPLTVLVLLFVLRTSALADPRNKDIAPLPAAKHADMIAAPIKGPHVTDDDEFWLPLGSGLNAPAFTMTVYNDQLIVGGGFSQAGGIPVNRIAAWDGSSWSSLGTGMNGDVMALSVYEGDLVAGGLFNTAGGVAVANLAVWNGVA